MRMLTDFIVRVADLAEAEGRSLRAGARSLALMIALVAGGVGLALIGACSALGGLWLLLADALGFAGASLLVGGVAALIGGGVAWFAHTHDL